MHYSKPSYGYTCKFYFVWDFTGHFSNFFFSSETENMVVNYMHELIFRWMLLVKCEINRALMRYFQPFAGQSFSFLFKLLCLFSGNVRIGWISQHARLLQPSILLLFSIVVFLRFSKRYVAAITMVSVTKTPAIQIIGKVVILK